MTEPVAYAGKNFGGIQGRGSDLLGGPGAEPPGRRRIFEILQKIPEENCKKCCIFAYFAKKVKNYALNFRAFWRKHVCLEKIWENFENFDENSMEKLNFYLFLGKFVAKNGNFGNNIIFLQQFFRLGGGSKPPNPPPPYATVRKYYLYL